MPGGAAIIVLSFDFYEKIADMAATTAPIFRTISYSVWGANVAATGTSTAATVSAVGAAAAGAVPVIAMAGVFVALGLPYHQARQEARRERALWGFAEGFVMGISNWTWHQAWMRFGRKEVGTNAWGQGISVAAYEGYNRGLKTGFALVACHCDFDSLGVPG
ncbi:hypothetical protein ACFFWD_02180 [Bradyrhizobium erythrophlei]|uniref:hypothetical protein n=1 Tax=Bradyrhizobium erythrophlei TaxID=1437360 RepID=UPI0035EBC946